MMFAETALASNAVIRHRSNMMEGWLRQPLATDVAEINLMVSEKIWAFSRSTMSMLADLSALQLAIAGQMPGLMMAAARGRMPSMSWALRSGNRMARSWSDFAGSGTRALVPIHRTAKANQRRLGRT
jgi:hypothetical protein